jgi:hypothetical protein
VALALVHSQGSIAASGTGPNYTVTSTGSAAGTGLIIVIGWRIAVAASQTITGVIDNKGNTWVKAQADNDATSTQKADVWYVDPATYISGVTTITPTFSIAASSGWFFYEVSGMANAPLDAAPTGTHASSTAPTITTAVLAQATEFAVAGIAWGSNAATISGQTAGWTLDTNQVAASPNMTLAPAHQITAATTALTYAGTLSGSNRWSDLVATFKEGSGTSAALATTIAGTGAMTDTTSVSVAAVATISGAGAATQAQAVAVASTALPMAGTGAMTAVALQSNALQIVAAAAGAMTADLASGSLSPPIIVVTAVPVASGQFASTTSLTAATSAGSQAAPVPVITATPAR